MESVNPKERNQLRETVGQHINLRRSEHELGVRFWVFMAVIPKNAIFWDIVPCGSCKNQHFRGMHRLSGLGTALTVTSNRSRSVLRLLVTANVPSSPILVNLITDAIRPSETSVLTRVTQRSIQEDDILHELGML
jgi:hypothetical protein